MSEVKEKKLIKFLSEDLKSVDEDNYIVEAIISTNAEDRHGEKVIQNGWDTSAYQENPVVLLGHDVDQVIGKAVEINVQDDMTTAKIKFAVEEDSRVKTVWKLLKGGYLKGISVGFINKVREGAELLENELIEISVVAVPANAEAFVLAMDSGVIDKKDAVWLKQTMQREIKAIESRTKDTETDEKLTEMLVTLNTSIVELKEVVGNLTTKLDKQPEPKPDKGGSSPEDNKEDESDDSAKDEPSEDSSGTDEDEVDPDNLTDEQAETVAEAVDEALNDKGEDDVEDDNSERD